LIDKIDTQLLDLACEYQESRVSKDGTIVPFNFTEGWFRNSGIYDLNAANQAALSLLIHSTAGGGMVNNF